MYKKLGMAALAGAAAYGMAGPRGRRASDPFRRVSNQLKRARSRVEKDLILAQWAAGYPYPYEMALERRYMPGGMESTLDRRKWAEDANLDEMSYGSSDLRGDEVVDARIYNHDSLGGGVVGTDLIIDLGAGTVGRYGQPPINFRDPRRRGWMPVDEWDFSRQLDAADEEGLDELSRKVSSGLFNRRPSGRSARWGSRR